jgi:predicted nucleic acid-binding protein
MVALDTSIAVKWFKPGEPHEAEALDLCGRIDRGEVEGAANEIISLEIVRGLVRTLNQTPQLGLAESDIEAAFARMEALLSVGNILECGVREVKGQAKDLEIRLGLYAADALHLATAIHLGAAHFVTDDHHLLRDGVVKHAASCGVAVVNLPGLLSALDASAEGSS